MQYVKIYLSTAPVVAAIWFVLLAASLIEVNRFFPDALLFPFLWPKGRVTEGSDKAIEKSDKFLSWEANSV